MFDCTISVPCDLRTSEKWFKTKRFKERDGKEYIIEIIEPLGWNTKRFIYSWYEEKITEQEFDRRLERSDVEVHLKREESEKGI